MFFQTTNAESETPLLRVSFAAITSANEKALESEKFDDAHAPCYLYLNNTRGVKIFRPSLSQWKYFYVKYEYNNSQL